MLMLFYDDGLIDDNVNDSEDDVCMYEEPGIGEDVNENVEVEEEEGLEVDTKGYGSDGEEVQEVARDDVVRDVERNATWICECHRQPSRKRKVDPLREGLEQDEDMVVKRKTKKCGCGVELYASVNEQGNWVVRRVKLEHHGHIVTPRKSKDVSMHCKHELMVKNKHLVNQTCAARKSRVKKDLENAVVDHKKLELTESDANGMIEYFNKMSAENQNFFHLCRFGKDGALQDVVWVDTRSRAAYKEFGDVVYFNSTYLTNKFHLPFAVFIGVNHHGQSILLGYALISPKTAETYEWVMWTWLHYMGGKAPISILTD
ncbi:protein FAR-RED ELONGATED HYPOCOTYL 3-like [Chenopodium quinoa]|uniref:protein FAR-RED ELONGATED HYPOCOTYL 3-like n=1 Tax=Chenopodium quinoa TaxID=63459 RepID=UPI000B78F354|nr:protein FAR-RED ELONGATED HYPOCOTYL 3-like [Chenopodium quinoa]